MPTSACHARSALLLALIALAGAAAAHEPDKAPRSGDLSAHWLHAGIAPYTPALAKSLKVPDGYALDVVATGLEGPRMLLPLDDGSVLVSRPDKDDVVRVSRDGKTTTVAKGLDEVHGLARDGDTVYLAGIRKVWAASLNGGTLGEPRTIVEDLPNGAQHAHRGIAVHDGWLYVSIGSPCNACDPKDPEYAAVLRMRPDGKDRSVYASGLRDTIGLAVDPGDGSLWGGDNGVDWRGNDTPPDEINRIVADGRYGWPQCYGDREVDRVQASPDKAPCAKTRPPALALPAHSAPLAMAFASDGTAFVTLHGSWNRDPARDPRAVRLRREDGRLVAVEDFLTGFAIDGGKRRFGRPAGVAVANDGSVLVSDDANGVLYRISRKADQRSAGR